MQLNTTAIGFFVLALGLTVCGFWFLHAWRRSENKTPINRKISLLLTLLFSNFGLQNGLIGIGAVLFAKNPKGLYGTLVVSHVFLITSALIAVYTAYFIFAPKTSPLLALIMTGGVGVAMYSGILLDRPLPFLTEAGGIEWNMSYWLSVFVFLTLFISIGGTLFIFGNLYQHARTKETKNLALIIAGTALLGVINIFIRLIILENESFRTRLFDSLLTTIGIIFIVALLIWPLIKNWVLRKTKTAD